MKRSATKSPARPTTKRQPIPPFDPLDPPAACPLPIVLCRSRKASINSSCRLCSSRASLSQAGQAALLNNVSNSPCLIQCDINLAPFLCPTIEKRISATNQPLVPSLKCRRPWHRRVGRARGCRERSPWPHRVVVHCCVDGHPRRSHHVAKGPLLHCSSLAVCRSQLVDRRPSLVTLIHDLWPVACSFAVRRSSLCGCPTEANRQSRRCIST